jgi:hypothetical protein
MPAQLPLGVYRLIIQYFISSGGDTSNSPAVQEEQAQTFGLPPTAMRRGNQASLAKLMRVSKVSSIESYWADVQKLYEVCKTELYKDCLVADIDTFAQDISSNPRKMDLLARVRTLRLYQRDYYLLKEPTYVELISRGEWRFLGLKEFLTDYHAGLRQAFQDL